MVKFILRKLYPKFKEFPKNKGFQIIELGESCIRLVYWHSEHAGTTVIDCE